MLSTVIKQKPLLVWATLSIIFDNNNQIQLWIVICTALSATTSTAAKTCLDYWQPAVIPTATAASTPWLSRVTISIDSNAPKIASLSISRIIKSHNVQRILLSLSSLKGRRIVIPPSRRNHHWRSPRYKKIKIQRETIPSRRSSTRSSPLKNWLTIMKKTLRKIILILNWAPRKANRRRERVR